MKLLHLADLHLGRRLAGFDLLEDQRHILEQAVDLCAARGVDAVVLAGDIYDTALPPAAGLVFDRAEPPGRRGAGRRRQP